LNEQGGFHTLLILRKRTASEARWFYDNAAERYLLCFEKETTLSGMVNAGVNLNAVKSFAGHVDGKTTLKYYT